MNHENYNISSLLYGLGYVSVKILFITKTKKSHYRICKMG